jgi:hypothetical protein
VAEVVAVADIAPAVREPEDNAAPPARRKAHPGPEARDKWVSASVTESIEDMIAAAFDEADRRDPQRIRQQLAAIAAQAAGRGLKVPVLSDYIHVSGYIGKAASALHPGDPVPAGQWADGQLLRVLHGRAKAVAATLASVAARARVNPRKRGLDLTDVDRAVTYLDNNRQHMKYGKALASGWPVATGMIEGACRFVMRYYKQRYRDEHHLARYDEATIEELNLDGGLNSRERHISQKEAPVSTNEISGGRKHFTAGTEADLDICVRRCPTDR